MNKKIEPKAETSGYIETAQEDPAAKPAAQDIPGEEITEEQMEAEGAGQITDAQVEETLAKATEQIKADPIAAAVRGLAIGIIAGMNDGKDKKIDQSNPAVQMMEPALDLVYFAVSGLNRMAAALEKMADAQAALVEQNERALAPAFVVNLEPAPAPEGETVGALSEQG